MTQYFEYSDEKSSKFWEITIEGTLLKTRYGKIGTAGQTTEKSFSDTTVAQKEYDKLVKEKTAKGYVEIGNNAVKSEPSQEKKTNTYIIETFEKAREKYSIHFLDYYVELQYEKSEIVVFTNDAYFSELDVDAFAKKNKVKALLFCKNLSANTYIYQKTSDYGPLIIVLGNVQAKNIYLRGSDVYVMGNIKATQTFIPGDYNHGSKTIKGTIQAELLLATDDHSFDYDAKNIKNTLIVGLDFGSKATLKVYDVTEILDTQYFEDEDSDYWDRDLVTESIKNGISLLKDNLNISKLKTINQKNKEKLKDLKDFQNQDVINEIAKNKKTKNPVLDLSRRNISKLPIEVTELLHLKELYIEGSSELQMLPPELTHLQKLEHISISYCGFTVFPAVITTLKNIESINISGNAINDLPKELSLLKNINHINCNSTNITRFPKVLFELPFLEEISFFNVSNTNYTIDKPLPSIKTLDFLDTSKMPSIKVQLPILESINLNIDTHEPIPTIIFECKNLKQLEIVNYNDAIQTLPEKITQLQNLEEIAFSVANTNNIELLKNLPKLRKISIYLEDLHPHFNKILELPQWTEIDVCGIDMLNYNEFHEDLWKPILERKNLKKIFFSNDEWDVKSRRKQYNVKL